MQIFRAIHIVNINFNDDVRRGLMNTIAVRRSLIRVSLTAALATTAASTFAAGGNGQRFHHNGRVHTESSQETAQAIRDRFTEAPTGFDNRTNGFTRRGRRSTRSNEDNVVALRSFNDNRFIFEEVETIADGLGPTYNAQSCRECHQNVVTGGASQVAEHRTGRLDAAGSSSNRWAAR